MTLEQLGTAIGIEESTAPVRIHQYEHAKNSPAFETVQHLARVLHVPVPFMYAEDDELAAWILAFDKVSPSTRCDIVKKGQLDTMMQKSDAAVAKKTRKPRRRTA